MIVCVCACEKQWEWQKEKKKKKVEGARPYTSAQVYAIFLYLIRPALINARSVTDPARPQYFLIKPIWTHVTYACGPECGRLACTSLHCCNLVKNTYIQGSPYCLIPFASRVYDTLLQNMDVCNQNSPCHHLSKQDAQRGCSCSAPGHTPQMENQWEVDKRGDSSPCSVQSQTIVDLDISTYTNTEMKTYGTQCTERKRFTTTVSQMTWSTSIRRQYKSFRWNVCSQSP